MLGHPSCHPMFCLTSHALHEKKGPVLLFARAWWCPEDPGEYQVDSPLSIRLRRAAEQLGGLPMASGQLAVTCSVTLWLTRAPELVSCPTEIV